MSISRFVSPEREMDMHAEVTVPAGGENIFKGKKSLVRKEGKKYIPEMIKLVS